MTYQTSDEEVNLLESQSDVNVPIKSTSNYAKAAIAGAISLILIVAFTINQPAQIPNISNSFSNLKSVFGNVVNKNTIDFGSIINFFKSYTYIHQNQIKTFIKFIFRW